MTHPHLAPRALPSPGPWRYLPVLGLLLLALAAPARGQGLLPKRQLLGGSASMCGAPPPAAAPASRAAARAVDSLLAAGSRAAILGDHASARATFRRAIELDPRNPILAYRLARTNEEMGDGEAAIAEYCRYLALAPAAADAAEVRARIALLAPPPPSELSAEGLNYLRAGLEAYDGGRYERAAYSFTVVLRGCPDCAAVYYDRALAYAASQRKVEAIRDLRKYLELQPDADDREAVTAYVETLRAALALDPAMARRPMRVLVQGLVVPGLGQLATGRPAWGLAVLGGVGAALYYGTRTHEVVRTVEATDPFGNPYQYERRSLERTHLGAGIGIAVSLGVASAVEAYLHAARALR